MATVTRVLPWRRHTQPPAMEVQEIVEQYRRFHSKLPTESITEAYRVAAGSHKGQLRRSGEPYITHPLAVAGIVCLPLSANMNGPRLTMDMFVRFAKEGLPKIESLNMYGASARQGNKHFDDQVEGYLQQKTRPMTLDKDAVYKGAERVYHPQ